MLSVFLVGIAAIILAAAATEGAKEQIEFGDFRIRFEFNSSGPDLGIQVDLDGEPWNEVKCTSPNGPLFEIKASGRLKNFGLTELFWESNEPELSGPDAVPVEDILARFPAGEYTCVGKTIEKDRLVGTATLTHAIPDGPSDVSVGAVNGSVVISWVAPPGTSSLTGQDVNIVGYQVVVERENPSRTFDIKLPGTATSVTIPAQFLEPSTEYTFEVLALEEGGNQTITEGEPFTFPLP
jgi:hypothetical protein